MTCDVAFVVGSEAASKEWAYSVMSRARKETRYFSVEMPVSRDLDGFGMSGIWSGCWCSPGRGLRPRIPPWTMGCRSDDRAKRARKRSKSAIPTARTNRGIVPPNGRPHKQLREGSLRGYAKSEYLDA
jgi:hypothetical protein